MVGHWTFGRGDQGSKPPAAGLKLGGNFMDHVFSKRLKPVGPSAWCLSQGSKKNTEGNGKKNVVDSLTVEKKNSKN